jgi:putative DNA primase/helicase
MTAAEIAAVLGGAHRSGAWWRCRCPVHGSRGATLALRDGGRGLIVHCHAGCEPRDVLAELRRCGLIGGDFLASPSRPIPRGINPSADRVRRTAAARSIWNGARDARGSPVAAYLAARRITIDPPPVLRYAPALRRPDGSYGPAMVARIDSLDGELIGISRTRLDRDATGQWHRRDRAMLGGAAGGAVRLAPAAEVLMLAEGIETAMAAMTATMMPAWAALSTSGLMTLALPPIVATVVILADHDVSGAGERAARTAAARWLREDRRVRIALPPEPGSDFNDVLLGRAHARVMEARDVAA